MSENNDFQKKDFAKNDPPKKDFRKQDYKGLTKMLTMLSQLSYLMITPILITIIGGSYLDNYFGTSPIILVIGVILGVMSAFKNLYDFSKRFK